MFTQFKNIDTAFRHIRLFSIMLIIANVLIGYYYVYKSYQFVNAAQGRIYVLYNGKVLQAMATDRKSNLPVELRDHISTFHQYFFNLIPDDKAIQASISKALYLADQSAKRQYDNLKESGYYNNLISANISEEIEIDSTVLDIDSYPFSFVCYASQKLTRSTSTATKRLVTKGQIRDLKKQTDDNPHGFLIQNWEIIENQNLVQ
ncbi:conjugative transposon protein TraK [Olivibacter jilunii]|uniref:conjugative transposon protein TraK n=1 Tax=Olivibacter jilunii TaxID=985016 RepID=UPI00102FF2B9|nr:conjugative transposon protein TraK [Olivibacter jilunii]